MIKYIVDVDIQWDIEGDPEEYGLPDSLHNYSIIIEETHNLGRELIYQLEQTFSYFIRGVAYDILEEEVLNDMAC